MSTMHKFKAYFGMVPLDDYEDDYLDETDAPRPSRGRGGYELDDRDDDRDAYNDREHYPEPAYAGAAPRHSTRVAPLTARGGGRPGGGATRPSTRGALAMDTRSELRNPEPRRAVVPDDGGAVATITTLRPRDYSEARTIGERFRDGTPVIMDLVEMSNADAKRLVDFAAGLAFALRGSFDKVATKVFLLSPADVDVSAEERRRIAETGFYNQQ
ncbi:cell division protein SepF [Rhodococcoides trifolii]|uniref:Cell division protein SepF n=1 Tax=Rhodococcoides trifolii TaxID=908250 RepID=A0A917D147_9NOCA|nr:cell division protein SepF [Rhodococcus trifolii]GGG05539.1 cell division protein SepF [Rhodococcus trifolii]